MHLFLQLLLIVMLQPSLHAQNLDKASFTLQVSKSEIWQYGSYVVTAKAKVRVKPGEYWQFYDRNGEALNLMDSLIPPRCRFHRNNFLRQQFVRTALASGTYDEFTLDEVGISPTQPGIIKIPSLSVKMARFSATHRPLDSIMLQSEPVNIVVKALPQHIADSVYGRDYYRMVGSFQLVATTERSDFSYRVGDTIPYSFALTGHGSGHSIEPVIRQTNLATVTFTKAVKDTARGKLLRHRTEFHLQIVPHQRGNLRLEDLMGPWAYFSVGKEQIKYLSLQKNFTIVGKDREKPPPPSPSNTSLVIVLDVSESMRIEDYNRNRLSVGIDIVNLLRQQQGPVPVVVFAGDTKVIDNSTPLDTSVINLVRTSGTAIGDAIWQAKDMLSRSGASDKRIVLIGDGDNTAGSVTETLAAESASHYGINVHCIGVGYTGKVPFGKDFFGNTRYVDDSYDDQALKKVARLTGGTFTWISKEDNLAKVTRSIIE